MSSPVARVALASAGLAAVLAGVTWLLPSRDPAPPPSTSSAPSVPPSAEASSSPESTRTDEKLRNTLEQPDAPGRWRKIRTNRFDETLTDSQRAKIEELEAIGYLAGSVEAREVTGIVTHLRDRAWAGLNFYTSGHAPEAHLVDMDGNLLHAWRRAFHDVWPEHPIDRETTKAHYWRRARLYPNGDVLAIFEGLGIVKLDATSEILWAHAGGEHHDLDVRPNGEIYVLTREAKMVPRIDAEEPILEEFIAVLDANGNLLREISLLECFENSEYGEIWKNRKEGRADIFHSNTLEVLDGRLAKIDPAFRAGNVLTSFRWLDAIAVVDLELRKIVWARRGDYKAQHDPQVLENGTILLFDNLGQGRASRALELDPADLSTTWEYRGSPGTPFFSQSCGTVQRLPNGNTLLTESDNGRAIEVDREGEIVWELVNPHRAGENREFIATLFEVLRLPPDFPTSWASE